jgi:hypothetical protein
MPAEGRGMFVEIAKPITLLFSILSLYGVFHTAFLLPATDVEQKISESVILLALAAGICLLSGLIFREAPENRDARPDPLTKTLPIQLFCWASSVMLILFLVSWYLKVHCIFYRDIRFY